MNIQYKFANQKRNYVFLMLGMTFFVFSINLSLAQEPRGALKARLKTYNGHMDGTATGQRMLNEGSVVPEPKGLFPEQIPIFEKIRDFYLKGGREGFVKAPTGVGKTVIFSKFTEAILGPKNKALIVVPTVDLINQVNDEILSFTNFKPEQIGTYFTSNKELNRQITLTTYNSFVYLVRNNLINPLDYDLLVLDEVHRGLSEVRSQEIQKFGHALRIGFTATPLFSEEKKVQNLLHYEIEKIAIRDAIQKEILVPMKTIGLVFDIDIANADRDTYFDEKELTKLLEQGKIVGPAIAAYREFIKLTGSDQAVIYCNGIEHSEKVAQAFSEAGIPAMAIHSGNFEYPPVGKLERRKILFDFRRGNGKFKVLTNPNVLIEGFDAPETGLVINLHPTLSAVVAEQRGGRAARKSKKNPDKIGFVIEGIYQNSKRDISGKPKQILYSQILHGEEVYGKTNPFTPSKIQQALVRITQEYPQAVAVVSKEELASVGIDRSILSAGEEYDIKKAQLRKYNEEARLPNSSKKPFNVWRDFDDPRATTMGFGKYYMTNLIVRAQAEGHPQASREDMLGKVAYKNASEEYDAVREKLRINNEDASKPNSGKKPFTAWEHFRREGASELGFGSTYLSLLIDRAKAEGHPQASREDMLGKTVYKNAIEEYDAVRVKLINYNETANQPNSEKVPLTLWSDLGKPQATQAGFPYRYMNDLVDRAKAEGHLQASREDMLGKTVYKNASEEYDAVREKLRLYNIEASKPNSKKTPLLVWNDFTKKYATEAGFSFKYMNGLMSRAKAEGHPQATRENMLGKVAYKNASEEYDVVREKLRLYNIEASKPNSGKIPLTNWGRLENPEATTAGFGYRYLDNLVNRAKVEGHPEVSRDHLLGKTIYKNAAEEYEIVREKLRIYNIEANKPNSGKIPLTSWNAIHNFGATAIGYGDKYVDKLIERTQNEGYTQASREHFLAAGNPPKGGGGFRLRGNSSKLSPDVGGMSGGGSPVSVSENVIEKLSQQLSAGAAIDLTKPDNQSLMSIYVGTNFIGSGEWIKDLNVRAKEIGKLYQKNPDLIQDHEKFLSADLVVEDKIYNRIPEADKLYDHMAIYAREFTQLNPESPVWKDIPDSQKIWDEAFKDLRAFLEKLRMDDSNVHVPNSLQDLLKDQTLLPDWWTYLGQTLKMGVLMGPGQQDKYNKTLNLLAQTYSWSRKEFQDEYRRADGQEQIRALRYAIFDSPREFYLEQLGPDFENPDREQFEIPDYNGIKEKIKLLDGIEKKLIVTSVKNKAIVLRPLSVYETPFTSRLGYHCVTGVKEWEQYAEKPYQVFTITYPNHRSQGSIVVMLGAAGKNQSRTAFRKAAVIEQVDNIDLEILPLVLNALEKIVFKNGYTLMLPEDFRVGQNNGISNDTKTAEELKKLSKSRENIYYGFKPVNHKRQFMHPYTRLYGEIDAYTFRQTPPSANEKVELKNEQEPKLTVTLQNIKVELQRQLSSSNEDDIRNAFKAVKSLPNEGFEKEHAQAISLVQQFGINIYKSSTAQAMLQYARELATENVTILASMLNQSIAEYTNNGNSFGIDQWMQLYANRTQQGKTDAVMENVLAQHLDFFLKHQNQKQIGKWLANIKLSSNNAQQLFKAAVQGPKANIDVIEFLTKGHFINLNEGKHTIKLSSVSTEVSNGEKLLRYAVETSDVQLLALCKKFNIDFNMSLDLAIGSTEIVVHGNIVYYAAQYGNVEILKYLRDEIGMGINSKTSGGNMLIHGAAIKGRVDVIQFLVQEWGSNVNVKGANDYTPIEDAIVHDHIEAVKELVKLGAKFDKKSVISLTSSSNMIRYLVVDLGADIHGRGQYGATVLHEVILHGEADTIKLLKELGFRDVSALLHEKNAIAWAAQRGYVDKMRILAVEFGAEISRYDLRTALTSAIERNEIEAIRFLIYEMGAVYYKSEIETLLAYTRNRKWEKDLPEEKVTGIRNLLEKAYVDLNMGEKESIGTKIVNLVKKTDARVEKKQTQVEPYSKEPTIETKMSTALAKITETNKPSHENVQTVTDQQVQPNEQVLTPEARLREIVNEIKGLVAKPIEYKAAIEKHKEEIERLVQTIRVEGIQSRKNLISVLGEAAVQIQMHDIVKTLPVEFSKFFGALCLAEIVRASFDGHIGTETFIELAQSVPMELLRYGTFSAAASASNIGFDLTTLTTQKLVQQYHSKAVDGITKIQKLNKAPLFNSKMFVKGQLSMLAGTVVNLMIYSPKLTGKEIFEAARNSQFGYLVAWTAIRQAGLRGSLMLASRLSGEALETARVGYQALKIESGPVVGLVILAAEFLIMDPVANYLGKKFDSTYQHATLYESLLRLETYLKGEPIAKTLHEDVCRTKTDSKLGECYMQAAVNALLMDLQQIVYMPVNEVTMTYQQKQNELDQQLGRMDYVDNKVDEYPTTVIAKNQDIFKYLTSLNQLWELYDIEANDKIEEVRQKMSHQDLYQKLNVRFADCQNLSNLECGLKALTTLEGKEITYKKLFQTVDLPQQKRDWDFWKTSRDVGIKKIDWDVDDINEWLERMLYLQARFANIHISESDDSKINEIQKEKKKLQQSFVLQLDQLTQVEALEGTSVKAVRIMPGNPHGYWTYGYWKDGYNETRLKDMNLYHTFGRETLSVTLPQSGKFGKDREVLMDLAYFKECSWDKQGSVVEKFIQSPRSFEKNEKYQISKTQKLQQISTQPSSYDWSDTKLRLQVSKELGIKKMTNSKILEHQYTWNVSSDILNTYAKTWTNNCLPSGVGGSW